MRARDDAHGTVLRPALTQRDPRSHDGIGLEAPVGEVLMPGNEALVPWLLDEEASAPHQNIRPDETLHGVEDVGVAHDLVHPREQQIAFGTQPASRQASRGLDSLEPLTIALSLRARQHADR